MWIYDEQGELVENDLAEELKHEIEIKRLLEKMQTTFDGLFEDNETVFHYRGFGQEKDKEVFNQYVEKVIALIKEKVGGKYLIENRIRN